MRFLKTHAATPTLQPSAEPADHSRPSAVFLVRPPSRRRPLSACSTSGEERYSQSKQSNSCPPAPASSFDIAPPIHSPPSFFSSSSAAACVSVQHSGCFVPPSLHVFHLLAHRQVSNNDGCVYAVACHCLVSLNDTRRDGR